MRSWRPVRRRPCDSPPPSTRGRRARPYRGRAPRLWRPRWPAAGRARCVTWVCVQLAEAESSSVSATSDEEGHLEWTEPGSDARTGRSRTACRPPRGRPREGPGHRRGHCRASPRRLGSRRQVRGDARALLRGSRPRSLHVVRSVITDPCAVRNKAVTVSNPEAISVAMPSLDGLHLKCLVQDARVEICENHGKNPKPALICPCWALKKRPGHSTTSRPRSARSSSEPAAASSVLTYPGGPWRPCSTEVGSTSRP
ncbi:hypothetical protein Pla86_34750 [Planctomycetes bacterium Pla86]|uniref:Uncharacterized protein n=1 Tax=Engelhardtia mirabilis TaxID=2528011 RepID=A0A518BN19_9BACT|nr:hypothetical protein Pla133_34770 [Planctomycetes bacterium Pla133]QDV02706.1 hypothetical protein Pla86_34750 [Planctomycetes bacterium Pla86]